ncbi:N-acyl-D-amino-acid deacylase family protein [Rhodohalobacter sp. 614A]|uniref:N-acyl-D-amino-acid deacylase family protein n=1 Tax=Rhodohalobacter sp. 614A TaxID=2908649 RepID=UPI001F2EDB40|nr:amidohydrolase family protein [Rhodohalobacter sp. 614A]
MTCDKRILTPFALIFVFLFSCSKPTQSQTEFDLLITNAKIVDGTGSEAFSGNILIDDGIIQKVGAFDTDTIQAVQTIDANGRVVSSGFIDTHSHGNPIETPRFDNFLSMGVTTISLGQDGNSPATENLSEWMDQVDSIGTGPNILHFMGHGTLRRLTNTPQQPILADANLEAMVGLMNNAMQAGSFGLTTGLEYESGRYATMPELVALAESVANHNGLVMSHVRSEDDTEIEDSIRELIEQGKKSGANIQASHIKVVYANNPTRAEAVLQLMNEAREKGIQITADVYPYTASFTGIGIVFPHWVTPANFNEVKESRRTELEEYLRNRIAMRNGPEATLFGTAPWAGMTLAEVADSLNKPFEDVLIDDIGPTGASAAYFVMNEEVMKRFLQDPHVMVSSDGSPTMRHPRGYGSFAKIIDNYVNTESVLTLEEAIHKMTGLPAEILGLSDSNQVEIPRGLLHEGFAADLLIFTPQNINDTADFENPHQYAEGFDWVFVNGEPVIEEGERNEIRPAGIIRKISK